MVNNFKKKYMLKQLTNDQLTQHKLVFIATIKLMSDQSAYLQGELKQTLKRDFNQLIKMADRLSADIEGLLEPESREDLQAVVDVLNNELCNLREQINK